MRAYKITIDPHITVRRYPSMEQAKDNTPGRGYIAAKPEHLVEKENLTMPKMVEVFNYLAQLPYPKVYPSVTRFSSRQEAARRILALADLKVAIEKPRRRRAEGPRTFRGCRLYPLVSENPRKPTSYAGRMFENIMQNPGILYEDQLKAGDKIVNVTWAIRNDYLVAVPPAGDPRFREAEARLQRWHERIAAKEMEANGA